MVLSMGPQHPSTHGVLQIVLEIDSENVVKADPEIGYLHTGIEKSGRRSLLDAGADRDRAHGLSRAVVQRALLRLGGRETARHDRSAFRHARRAMRVLTGELTRIASHCVWLGTHGIDLGAISVFFYCFDLRENILDLQEASGGARMHPNYVRVGGLNGDLPDGFWHGSTRSSKSFRAACASCAASCRPIRSSRTERSTSACSRRKKRCSGASPGPSLRASGIAYDVRKAFPYCGYETYDFDVPTRSEGDAYARFLVRLDEMDQSIRLIEQARRRLDTPGPVMIDDPKVALPPKETIALSMEALIHHFKLDQRRLSRAAGRRLSIRRVAARRARVLHRQQRREQPYRIRTRPPSMYNLQALKGDRTGKSHRRPRRHDRLARSRLRRKWIADSRAPRT